MNADTLLFFAGAPHALALYGAIEDAVFSVCPDVRVEVKKTQISFFTRRMFACVSLPRQAALRRAGGLALSIALPRPASSGRVYLAAQTRPGLWTHHILLTYPREIDAQLLAWLEEARAYAARG